MLHCQLTNHLLYAVQFSDTEMILIIDTERENHAALKIHYPL